jgi:hypothetical protein
MLLCYVDKCVRVASYKKASLTFILSSSFSSPLWGNTSEIFALFQVTSLFSLMRYAWKGLLWMVFADFGWIFLQLGFYALGFLDEVSNFLQFIVYAINVYGEIAILLQEVLFC